MIGIEYQLLKGLRTNNEFYVSLAYKGLITESNKNTEIAIARRFCQWGTPEDLEDWIYWNSNINYFNSNRVLIDQQYKDNKESAIILNLGLGTRISTVTTTSKWNIPVFSSRLIDFSIAIASSCNESLLITSDKVSTKSKKTQVYLYKGKTRGQAETASIGFTQIRNKDNPIHILSNDNIISQNEYWEIYRDLEPYDWEILVGVIKNYPAAQLAQNHYSWVHTNEANQIENISIKSKTEGMTRSIIGNFVFRNNRVFQNAMSFLPNNIAKHRDVHLDYIISDCLDEGMKAYAMEFRHFLSIGTSYEYRTLEYWNSLGILPEGSENE
jgi:dTDP-glucose pyrophosphorylase